VEQVIPLSALAVMSDRRRIDPDPDAELMLQFKAGKLEAFEELFSRHIRSVVNFAYRFVRNRGVAEELAQEIFLRVHDAAPSYRADAKFTTWLYRVATNICLNEVRRPEYRAIHESLDDPICIPIDLVDKGAPRPEAALLRQAVSEALRKALEALPEKQRLAFILNKYQDLSYVEVGEVMKISEKAVKSLIHRAKQAMAESMLPVRQELL
jgi:RNA polymerase sigma-70 factor (ECF subfamily)